MLENFCEVPLEGDPLYESIEVQRVQHRGVSGHTALLRRLDGELDIAFEQHLELDDEWVRTEPATAHQAIATLRPVTFREVRCSITPEVLDCVAEFDDVVGRRVTFRAHENFTSETRPIFTPAPPQKEPQNLRFLVLGHFRLLSRKADISLEVDGRKCVPAGFLAPSRVAPRYSARIGSDLLLASLTYTAGLGAAEVVSTSGGAQRISGSGHWLEARFEPGLVNFGTNAKRLGDVVVESDLGRVATGRFEQVVSDGTETLRLFDVVQDWHPGWTSPGRLALRAIRLRNRRDESWSFTSFRSIETDEMVQSSSWST